jgi:hypothetical protein
MKQASAAFKLQTKEEIRMYKLALTALCAMSLLAPLSAQAGEVNHREAWQQHRIYQGVKSGSVSPREYAHLERDEYRLNAQRMRDLHDGDGRDGLDRRQYVQLNREENHISRQIYRDKHNRRP